eukprot:scaffold22577_cov122-Cylindrotheca_fusiformis.AAC.17
MKLLLTAYQMYAWAATTAVTEEVLTKTFSLGLSVLASPSKWGANSKLKIEAHVLSQMQAVALRYARLVASQSPQNSFPAMLATGWAAQSALWQLQWLPNDEKREMILPRLAESMARRLMEQEGEANPSAEIQLLRLRIFEHQSKWSEMLDLLESDHSKFISTKEQKEAAAVSKFGVSMTWHQVQAEKARVLCLLRSYRRARSMYEDLLRHNPDNWACLTGHMDCCLQIGDTSGTRAFIAALLAQDVEGKYPIRGLHLMKVELAAHSFRSSSSESSLQELAEAIKAYGELFASHLSCAFSDLEAYVELLLDTENQLNEQCVVSLLDFANNLRKKHASLESLKEENSKQRQQQLRRYIFAIKLNHQILSFRVDLQKDYLVDWTELVLEWEQSLSLSSSSEGEESQKEIKPGDDLALLAVQQLLYKNSGNEESMIACAALLEKAIHNSPDNAYLKIAAMNVYSQLHATSRSWELFQAVGFKHIQLDSCSYTILPFLLQGGFYNELVDTCTLLLRFQANTARDCGDYAGRAMNLGTMSKADEFLVFQRQSINKSICVIEAKGMVLDAAPLLGEPVQRSQLDADPEFKGCLGLYQGIVGGESDFSRASRMLAEVHSPHAALSLVSWASNRGAVADNDDMVDNRDMSILRHQFLYKFPVASRESMTRNSLRRGHTHGLLLRASLCLDACKAPKKGKIVKASEDLEGRGQSLLRSLESTSSFISSSMIGDEYLIGRNLLEASVDLCRAVAIVGVGLPRLDNDSLEAREILSSDILLGEALSHLKKAGETLAVASVKDVLLILPSYVVPLFSLFRILSNICTLFGWGRRRRKTKQCASAMAEFALQFDVLIQIMLSVVERLPSTGDAHGATVPVSKEYLESVDAPLVTRTVNCIVEAQYRTRQRVEPIFQEMSEYLKSFDVSD